MITLQALAANDTDYIAKLNSNANVITSAVNSLQTNAQITAGSQAALNSLMTALFGMTPTTIGASSMKATVVGSTVNISSGWAWKASAQKVVQGASDLSLPLGAVPPGTYMIDVDTNGNCFINTAQGSTDPLYTLSYDGNSITSLTRLANVFLDGKDGRKIYDYLDGTLHF